MSDHFNLYNPASQDPEQLLAEFIDRKGLLERILDIIRHNGPDQPQQHLMLIGPRGMGKTTLLCAIKHRVDLDPELKAAWLPLLFQEEQYNIGDLADFWLESIRHLEAALHRPARIAERLLDRNPEDLAEQAREAFFALLAETSQRALLLIDNLNDIFRDIDDGQALHNLRALWMTDPRCMLIGAAASYFAAITQVDQAFHDFFRSFTLDRLNQEELEQLLRGYAQRLGDPQVSQILDQAPERVAALRILTGGNPRLVKLGYRVLRDGLDGDLRRDLERLLDEATPFFKHRIDSLKAKETRRVFDAIARRWDPVTVDDIRRELRKPSNYVSAQIRRLIEEGFVEEAGGDKKKRYQVGERFYNLYYLMRHSREGHRRLRWLVGFMQIFYSRRDFKDWAKRLEGELAGPLAAPSRAEKLAQLHALSEAADDLGRAEVFDALVRDAIVRNDRSALDEDTADGHPVESHGWRYLLVEVVWRLEPDDRRRVGFRPNDDSWWRRLRQALGKTGLERAWKHLDQLGGWQQDTPRHARAAGMMMCWLFQNLDEAEAAIRKALEQNPLYSLAWNNLSYLLNIQNRHMEAEAACHQTLGLDPQNAFAWKNLGIALVHQNRPAEAVAAFRKALELDPQFAIAWNNLGNILTEQNRFDEAEAACRRALELDPQYAAAWNNLGNSLADQQRYPEAEAAYHRALALDPELFEAHLNLAGTYLESMGRIQEGVSALLQGLALAPEHGFGYWLLARHWAIVLPAAATQILAQANGDPEGTDKLLSVVTAILMWKATKGEKAPLCDALLALEPEAQALFEPLLLALQALEDRSLLYRLAREKRELVLDVMARIDTSG